MIPADLAAVEAKIANVLGAKPQYFVTHPSELRVLKSMTEDELREFAEKHSWRAVRRVGGRQIEFYNDAGARMEEWR
jgi:branched-subunit amino acid aminotransferase/4-amino-4-deoxychorismate lyase